MKEEKNDMANFYQGRILCTEFAIKSLKGQKPGMYVLEDVIKHFEEINKEYKKMLDKLNSRKGK